MAASRRRFSPRLPRSRAGSTGPHRWRRLLKLEEHDMPDTSLSPQTASPLAREMRSFTGLFTEKTFDWDAFPASRGFPDLARAQLRYIGAGGSPKSNDPTTLKAEHFTFSLVNQP